jgi:hypothetical protein
MLLKEILNQFGYGNLHDFIESLIKPKFMLFSAGLSITLASISAVVEDYLGVPLPLFIGFLALIIVEFYTGVFASRVEGMPFTSRKAGRIIIKLLVYTLVLLILNTYKQHSIGSDKTGIIGDSFLNTTVYSVFYWFVFHLISIQLIRSIFENLHRIGYIESSLIGKVLNSRILKIFSTLTGKPETEAAKDLETTKKIDKPASVETTEAKPKEENGTA